MSNIVYSCNNPDLSSVNMNGSIYYDNAKGILFFQGNGKKFKIKTDDNNDKIIRKSDLFNYVGKSKNTDTTKKYNNFDITINDYTGYLYYENEWHDLGLIKPEKTNKYVTYNDLSDTISELNTKVETLVNTSQTKSITVDTSKSYSLPPIANVLDKITFYDISFEYNRPQYKKCINDTNNSKLVYLMKFKKKSPSEQMINGKYQVTYNLSWLYENKKGTSDEELLNDCNSHGILINVIKVNKDKAELIPASIKHAEGISCLNNINHTFLHDFTETSELLFLIYNLHEKADEVDFKVLPDSSFIKLDLIN